MDKFEHGLKAAGSAAGGISTGAVCGGLIGSFFGLVGTVLGVKIGAGIGTAFGAISGISDPDGEDAKMLRETSVKLLKYSIKKEIRNINK